MSRIDYLVVGGGIAGITVAHQILDQGRSFRLLVGKEGKHTSSRVAAGLYNPITGRKMVKTWEADNLFPYLEQFYQKVEKKLGKKVLFNKTIYRPFLSFEEQNDWIGKSSDSAYAKFIKEIHTRPRYEPYYHDPYGGIALNHSGWVDVNKYLDASIEYFKNTGVKVESTDFNHSDIQFEAQGVVYKNTAFGHIIFCEGQGVLENPFFSWLPISPLKGEIIDVHLPFKVNEVFNRGIFILPLGDNRYRVGSTYSHSDQTWAVTEEGKRQLATKLEELVNTDFKITQHRAGLRPSTMDRRPFLGPHPENDKLLVFNGLGTKGVSLAPYFSDRLIRFIENDLPLQKEVNIQRFFSLYCNQEEEL